MRQVLCLNSHMAQERLCSRASFSCMGPPGMQPGLITPNQAIAPRRAAGISHGVSRGVQQTRVGGGARAGTARDDHPLQPALTGSSVLPGGTGWWPSCTLLRASGRALPQPCPLTSSSICTSEPTINGRGADDLCRGVQDIKILCEWEHSGGAQTGSLLVSISPRGARSLAFLTALRLCRHTGARGKPLAVEKVRARPVPS